MFDAAARMGDFIGRHRRVADEDHLVIMAIFVKDVPHLVPFGPAALIVLPHALIRAIVEIEEFEILEFGRRGAEESFAQLDERFNRSADVEEEQPLYSIPPCGGNLD